LLDKSKADLEKDGAKGKKVIKLEEIEANGFHLSLEGLRQEVRR